MSTTSKALTLACVVALSTASCYRGSAAISGDDLPSASPTSDASESNDACGSIVEHVEYAELTLDNLRRAAGTVVHALIVSQGDSFWDSPTGQAPTESDRPGPDSEFRVLTRFNIAVSETLIGSVPSAELEVVIEGGTVNCYQYVMDPQVSLVAGADYVLFLQDPLTPEGEPRNLPMIAWMALEVVDGSVETPLDGRLSVDALRQTLAGPNASPASDPSG